MIFYLFFFIFFILFIYFYFFFILFIFFYFIYLFLFYFFLSQSHKNRHLLDLVPDLPSVLEIFTRLHGPRLLPDKAKVTMCSIIKLATIAFDETSSYWSAPKSS